MLNFFRSFPKTEYQFTDDRNSQQIIVDINRNVRTYLDEMDNANSYLYYDVNDGSRPDQLSMELYQTPAYWWTFFIVNDHLRDGLHTWPKQSYELEQYIDEKYNRTIITLIANSGSDITSHLIYTKDFTVGETVAGTVSNAVGTLIEADKKMNRFIVETTSGTFINNDTLAFPDSGYAFVPGPTGLRVAVEKEKDAAHHYEDANGYEIQRLQFSDDEQLITEVSNFEYETNVNDSRIAIRVINPAHIDSFATRYRKLINS